MESTLANIEQLPLRILLVTGVVDDVNDTKHVVETVCSGISKWCDTTHCQNVVDTFLHNLPSQCTASVDPDSLAPCTTVFCNDKEIKVVLVINPTCFILVQEVKRLLISPSKHRLLVFGGYCIDSRPEWYLQDGLFSMEDILNSMRAPRVDVALKKETSKPTLTISCARADLWKVQSDIQILPVEIEVIDPFKCDAANLTLDENNEPNAEHIVGRGLQSFGNYLEELINEEVRDVFMQLAPPEREGFLKIRHPALYIFPGGFGDSTFFTVNGCNILINGGALTSPWFWRLLRHQDRIDCIIATHLGSDCLFGLNSFFLRKVHEKQLHLPMDNTTDEYQKVSRCLISPDVGEFFINVPQKFLESGLKKHAGGDAPESQADHIPSADQLTFKTVDIVQDTLRLSKALGLNALPMTRKQTPEPFTVFSKVGIGKLVLFTLNPEENSKGLTYIREKWGCDGDISAMDKTKVTMASGEEGESLLTDLASISCLVVWYPASPTGKIVRLLFPGNASQVKIFEGLERIKDSGFLSMPLPSANLLSKPKAAASPSKPARSAKTVGSNSKPSGPNKAHTKPGTSVTSAPKSKPGAASAVKKPAQAAKKQPAKEVGTTSATRTKREPHEFSKPADKRAKPDKPPSAAAKASSVKSRPGPVHAKAEARVHAKSKQPASKSAAKTSAVDVASKADAKTTKRSPSKATTFKATAPPAAVVSQAKKQTYGHSAKAKPVNNKEKSRKAPKTSEPKQLAQPVAAPRTPPEDLTEAFALLKEEESAVNDAKPEELPKRPSPEGEDMRDNEQFVEGRAGHVTVRQEVSKVPELPEATGDSFAEDSSRVKDDPGAADKLDDVSASVNDNASSDEALKSGVKTEDAVQEAVDSTNVEMEPPSTNIETKPPTDYEKMAAAISESDTQVTNIANDSPISETEHETAEPETLLPELSQGKDVKVADPVSCDTDAVHFDEQIESSQLVDSAAAAGGSLHELAEKSSAPYVDTESKADRVLGTPEENADDQVDIVDVPDEELAAFDDEDEKDVLSLEEKLALEKGHDFTNGVKRDDEQNASPEEAGTVDEGSSVDPNKEGSSICDGQIAALTAQDPAPDDFHSEDYGSAFRADEEAKGAVNFDMVRFEGDIVAEDPVNVAEDVANVDHATSAPVEPANQPDMSENVVVETDQHLAGGDFAYTEAGLGSSDASLGEAFESRSEAGQSEQKPIDPIAAVVQVDYFSMESGYPDEHDVCADEGHVKVDGDDATADSHPNDEGELEEEVRDANPRNRPAQIVTFDDNMPVVLDALEDFSFADEESAEQEVREQSEEWHPTPYPSDPQSMLTDTSPSDLGSYEVQTPGEETPGALDSADERADSNATPELKVCEERAMSNTPISSAVSSPTEHLTEASTESSLNPIFQPNTCAQLLDVEQDPLVLEKSLEKDELLSSDIGHSFSTATTTTSKKAILESPVSAAELDSTYNIPSVGGSISAGMSSVATDYQASRVLEVSELHPPAHGLLDANGNEKQADDIDEPEKKGAEDLATVYPEATPTHAWPEVAEEERSADDLQRPATPEQVAEDLRSVPTAAAAIRDEFDQELSHLHADKHSAQDVQRQQSREYELINDDERHPVLKITESMFAEFDGRQSAVEAGTNKNGMDSHGAPFMEGCQQDDVDVDHNEMEKLHSDAPAASSTPCPPTLPSTNPFAVDFAASQLAAGQSAFNQDFTPVRREDPMMALDSVRSAKPSKKLAGSSDSKKSTEQKAFYFDLAYIPHHANKNHVNVEFFKRIRSRYYVISGVDASADEPSGEVLRYLLEGKKTWGKFETAGQELENVTVIPTHNSQALHDWYQDYRLELQADNIHLVASGSKVIMHDETVEACKVEF